MKKIILTLLLMTLPISVFANYNPVLLKKGIETAPIFNGSGWSDNGGMSKLSTTVPGLKILVLKENAALTMRLENDAQLGDTVKRCEQLAFIGMTPDADGKSAIVDMVNSVTKDGPPKNLTLNGVELVVEYVTIKRLKKAVFSCSLSAK
ncbi:MAG: hypothetical protein OEZ68_00840 [Gammaproteobacteria bacterium]|nr:hypothetical protein [Gammaproteobacteria bacterium]MDH5799325.1 hypothetical protein [Gammaproteobacteria bacterium]